MQAVTHETIERHAYHLWEQAGRPFGRSDEFWMEASAALAALPEAAPVKAKKATAPKAKKKTPAKA
jgi:hypothetical protein